MPALDPNPPPFQPTGRYTEARREALHKVHSEEFLQPAERDLMDDFMCKQQAGFAWNDTERGRFRTDFFPPVEFPTVPHVPWVQRNIPIPPGLYEEVCGIIRKKIDAGVYEPSNSAYHSIRILLRSNPPAVIQKRATKHSTKFIPASVASFGNTSKTSTVSFSA